MPPCLQKNYCSDVFSIFLDTQDTEAVSEDAQVVPIEDLPDAKESPSIALRLSSSSVLIPDNVRSPESVPSSTFAAVRTGNVYESAVLGIRPEDLQVLNRTLKGAEI